MAYDPSSSPKDSLPLNIARTVIDDPHITVATRFYPNPGSDPQTPGLSFRPVFMPPTVSDTGLVVPGGYANPVPGVATWLPCAPGPVGHTGTSAVGGGLGLGLGFGSNAADQSSNDIVSGFRNNLNFGDRGVRNWTDQFGGNSLVNGNDPNQGSRKSGSSSAADVGSEVGEDSVSGKKKVKLLCSFGGKILPRPSDGLLRYAGGETRLICVKRNVSFNELLQKMVDVCEQNVVIKYQLPDEDLDALVSISCPDDLDNMMEEYEKLFERSSDGSAKLRVFLFSASELDPTGLVHFGNLHDSGQKYVEAVNGVMGGVSGRLVRKDSLTSVGSTQNSEHSGGGGGGGGGGDVLLNGSGPILRENLVSSLDTTAPCPSQTSFSELEKQHLFGHDMRPSGITQSTPYLQAYADPRIENVKTVDYLQCTSQMGFPSPQLLSNNNSIYTQNQPLDNASSVTPHQFIPTVHVTMTPSSPHIGVRPIMVRPLVQPHQNHFPQESSQETKIVSVPVDQSYTIYQTRVPAQVVGGYSCHKYLPSDSILFSDGLVHPQPIISRETSQKVEGCHVCQKVLPHAHSDPVVQDQKVTVAVSTPDSAPVYHSLIPEDVTSIRQVNNIIETETFREENPDYGRILPTHGQMVGSTRSFQDTVRPQPLDENIRVQASSPLGHKNVRENHGELPVLIPREDNVGLDNPFHHPIDGFVENFETHLPERYLMGDINNSPSDKAREKEIVKDKEQEMEGTDVLFDNIFGKSVIGLDPNHISQTEQISSSAIKFPPLVPDILPMESSQPNKYPIPYCPGISPRSNVGNPQLDSSEVQFSSPTYSALDVPYAVNELQQVTHLQDNNPLLQQKIIGNAEAIHLKDNATPSHKNEKVEDSSNSLFSYQAPWNLHDETQFGLPNPQKNHMKTEAIDHVGENYLGSNEEIDANMILKDVQLQPLNNLNKDFSPKHVISRTGSAEERVKQELKAVAEGVAASVFQSDTSSEPELPMQTNDCSNRDVEKQHKTKFEEMRTRHPERPNFGVPVSDSMGRLQIIKNIDLEELRELGSGTFGTVYYGKWRGTDVAIKRINDRCFAGKPYEQGKMMDDFWNEAIKLADLHHPNVVAFYGVVLDGPGGLATVTEYMVNGSLRNSLRKNESFDKRKCLLIAMDVAFGMEYLHGKNIVHFDLKSDNLLVNLRDCHRPICKVGDLGLSKAKCQTWISGGVRGTLPWMAPELLNGSSNRVTEKVDVFSYGIVMWELLTGEEPYADLHYGAIIGGIVSNTLRPPIPETCDSDWRSLMERCWTAESSDRPDFTEIANELRSMAAKLPPIEH